MRKTLEFQADRIEMVLAMNKVPARVTGGTVTPRWVRFQVLPAVGAKISKIKGLSEEMAAAGTSDKPQPKSTSPLPATPTKSPSKEDTSGKNDQADERRYALSAEVPEGTDIAMLRQKIEELFGSSVDLLSKTEVYNTAVSMGLVAEPETE